MFKEWKLINKLNSGHKLACLMFILISACLLPAAIAAGELESGMACFQKHDYKAALAHFNQALRENANDCNALYYEAITLHQLNQLPLAEKAYAAVILRFPNSEAARNSQKALSYLNPSYLKTFNQQIGSASRASSQAPPTRSSNIEASAVGQGDTSAEMAKLPNQARIPYQKEGRNLLVEAYINGHPVAMFYDSGAEVVVFRKSELEALGVRGPQGPPTGLSYGVGNGGAQKTWTMRANIKVGQIERNNFPIAVTEDPEGAGPDTRFLAKLSLGTLFTRLSRLLMILMV